MEIFTEILEHEFEQAVEIKSKASLRRFINLMIDKFAEKKQLEERELALKNDFQTLLEAMNNGFSRMDIRFEEMANRFDDVNHRFDDVNKRFDDVNLRFEDENKRFDDANTRFEDINRRFEDVNKKFSMMFAFLTAGFTILSLLIVLMKL